MSRSVLRIDEKLCIDCGFCRETCPFGAVVSAFTLKHRYEILADQCQWCGGPGKAPCEVFCPVPNAIVPDVHEPAAAVAAS